MDTNIICNDIIKLSLLLYNYATAGRETIEVQNQYTGLNFSILVQNQIL